ncbi:MAG: hypothetical protein IJC89_00995 [Clostridia bacterium]|nr:hypothetical protein [Clostridia bacterium]
MSETNKKDNEKYYKSECDFSDFKAVSSQDCTGLIPSGPVNDAEIKSYEETYDYRAQIHDKKDNKK